MSEALEQAYASNTTTPLNTLEFKHSALTGGVLRLVQGYQDLTATLEGSPAVQVTFSKSGLGIKLPDRSTDGNHDLVWQVDNVSNDVYTQLRLIQEANRTSEEVVICNYRSYLETDLSAPAGAVYRMTVTGASVSTHTAVIRATWAAFPDTSYPRERYYPTTYPGLKYA